MSHCYAQSSGVLVCLRVERWERGVLGQTGLWLVLFGGVEAGILGCWGLMLGLVWEEGTPCAV